MPHTDAEEVYMRSSLLTRRSLLAGLAQSIAAIHVRAEPLYPYVTAPGNGPALLDPAGWFPSVWSSAGWDTSRAKRITAGMDLKAALSAAEPGDILLLDPGVTWTGNFTLPVKSGDAPIAVASAAWQSLPPVGTRVSRAHAGYMPRIISPNSTGAITAASASHHWRLYGLDITSSTYSAGVLRLGYGDETAASELPHHIDVVQCLIHGDPTVGGKRGIAANAQRLTIRDSSLWDWNSDFQDTQAICGWACQRVYIHNCYCEATGENVFFGEYSKIPHWWPSDIVVTKSHLFKRPAWRGATGLNGSVLVVKNLLELKSGVRVHIHSNVLENCWSQGQKGYAFNLKPGTDPGASAPKTEQVLIEYNLIRNVEMAANVSGVQPTTKGLGTCAGITFRHNAFVTQPVQWIIQHTAGPVNDVTWDHNTFSVTNGEAKLLMYLPIMSTGYSSRLRFEDNIAPLGGGVKADSMASGLSSLSAAYGSDYSFTSNIFTNGTGNAQTNYPPGNGYDAAIEFRPDGFSQTKYSIVGCDTRGVAAATAGVVTT
jgi:hypothetical protein